MTDSLDISFEVPFVHRLRFTHDVLGADRNILVNLLETSGDERVRVQFWADQHVVQARPDLKQRCHSLSVHSDLIEQVGSLQVVPGGEVVKNDIHILERMLTVLHAANLDRRSYIVVIGGGAVLDAVGFAVAIAHRGLRLVRLPTTTLAQSDSGVGVKNAVNLFQKKNWIGTFAVPWAVINDTTLLETLDQRDFIGGFSEAVKVALLKDRAFFEQICVHACDLRRRDMRVAGDVIRESAEWHLKHITQGGDPFEMREARPLDFGHWSAHKLESLSDYTLRHGEAVAIGVAIDSVYSALIHGFPQQDADRVLACLCELGFDLSNSALEVPTELFAGLEEFRQHLGGRLTLTMLQEVGRPLNVHEVDRHAMRDAIDVVASYRPRSRIEQT